MPTIPSEAVEAVGRYPTRSRRRRTRSRVSRGGHRLRRADPAGGPLAGRVRERTTRDELAAELAAEAVPLDESERLAVRLHRDDLPRLDDGQYLEYDPRTGDVQWKDPRTVEAVLESERFP